MAAAVKLRKTDALVLADLPALGFEKVLELPFIGHDEHLETFRVYASHEGLLLATDTYRSNEVNNAKVWYNWRAKNVEYWPYISSGGLREAHDNLAWAGDHDARWGMAYNLDAMRRNGEFLSPWIARPFIWLLHYGDTTGREYDYKAINAERIALLPEWAQTMLGPDE